MDALHRAPIPRRRHLLEDSDWGIMTIAAVMHKMKVRPGTRFLVPPAYYINRVHSTSLSSMMKTK